MAHTSGNRFTKSFLIVLSLLFISRVQADIRQLPFTCFSISYEVKLPGTPGVIYEAVTGDISGWWDHTFSEKPYRFYIEAKPGGGFYEIYSEAGDGVLHATVIVADYGKMLRFEGPLGLSGRAVQAVHTYQFEAAGEDSTLMKFDGHFFGETQEGLPETVEKVWHHFLFERLKPYVEHGEHLK